MNVAISSKAIENQAARRAQMSGCRSAARDAIGAVFGPAALRAMGDAKWRKCARGRVGGAGVAWRGVAVIAERRQKSGDRLIYRT
jgi:uncharacterized protein YqjF (DUF2071 family)